MRISSEKKDKISEQILGFLFTISPKPMFTAHIAKEIARDEEFVKTILFELKEKGLISELKKNPAGKEYKKRSRWKLSESSYLAYKNYQ